jgi:hypothetical protein
LTIGIQSPDPSYVQAASPPSRSGRGQRKQTISDIGINEFDYASSDGDPLAFHLGVIDRKEGTRKGEETRVSYRGCKPTAKNKVDLQKIKWIFPR